ncbi:MAG: TusE/DsrC/DsvC family sulfur relay protein [gamma proteobacterium endosymbiont of Lamellibrachia anaximandri]|nr:TusE/DsrC/DsvC family sulfur relay protein [gamma proteobacterium endosymbiont of Lamellibrachia anaximandri]MBL3616329.1 TusE/DsrC/DsvC family sulfur relay protein [gamma proteobacterium endosymbiont of Lamellibrachia anaximandri]
MSTNPYATRIEHVDVDGKMVATDQEGYIQDMDDWSDGFVIALAKKEGLELTDDNWEVVRFIRDYYFERRVQAQVRDMIKHFRKVWGKERGNNRYLHDIFPKGGPQKQGNRLAGIRKTKGEH